MFNLEQIVDGDPENMAGDPGKLPLAVVSDAEIAGMDVPKGDVIFSGYTDLLQKFMALKDPGNLCIADHGEGQFPRVSSHIFRISIDNLFQIKNRLNDMNFFFAVGNVIFVQKLLQRKPPNKTWRLISP